MNDNSNFEYFRDHPITRIVFFVFSWCFIPCVSNRELRFQRKNNFPGIWVEPNTRKYSNLTFRTVIFYFNIKKTRSHKVKTRCDCIDGWTEERQVFDEFKKQIFTSSIFSLTWTLSDLRFSCKPPILLFFFY